MDFHNSDSYERTPPTQRRVLRQQTLPNPDPSYPSNNLKLPVSPKQQVSPQYSPYHTDNENEPELDAPPTQTLRYQIRRQSTLPCKPNESSKYLSTSPNRNYSRSPDPSAMEGEHGRYPPFVHQSSFPSNSGPDQFHRQLPTSPNRLVFNKSPDSGGENNQVSPRRFTRQMTLPNPDQQIKLLPTSPPKNKKSPQYMKRSPEFQRQHTISNPEGMSTLSVHQHGPKFLPISPRLKQSFLFPQPSAAPRTFLSQQNFPAMNEDQPAPTAIPIREHSKMIKVRSHSNEEYSFNKSLVPTQPTEGGRRLLPEIPNKGGSRSPSRLIRQDHVKDDKSSPISKTFAEAKQALEYEMQTQMYDSQYTNEYSELSSTFAEADENTYNEQESYAAYESGQQNIPMDQNSIYYTAEQTMQFHDAGRFEPSRNKIVASVKSAPESFMSDSSEYYTPDEYIKNLQKNRNRRRKSRELPADPEVIITSASEETRKYTSATQRSVSEESSPKTMKVLPRRSFSQPEKETQKKIEPSIIPSPIPLSENKLGNADADAVDKGVPRKPLYNFPKMLQMRGDSKSFDAVVRRLIKSDIGDGGDDKSQSMDDNLFSEKKEVRKKSISIPPVLFNLHKFSFSFSFSIKQH